MAWVYWTWFYCIFDCRLHFCVSYDVASITRMPIYVSVLCNILYTQSLSVFLVNIIYAIHTYSSICALYRMSFRHHRFLRWKVIDCILPIHRSECWVVAYKWANQNDIRSHWIGQMCCFGYEHLGRTYTVAEKSNGMKTLTHTHNINEINDWMIQHDFYTKTDTNIKIDR